MFRFKHKFQNIPLEQPHVFQYLPGGVGKSRRFYTGKFDGKVIKRLFLGGVRRAYFKKSDTQTLCPWKGMASYYHLEVEGRRNENAAWTYPETKPAAERIRGYVAFWRGVEVKP